MSDTNPNLITSGPVFAAAGLVHRVRIPDGPGPHPTVVMLHGRFGDENAMWVFGRTAPDNWLKISVRAIVAEGDGYSWHPPGDEWPAMDDFETAVDAVTRLLEALPAHYNADPQAISLMGFSQGAATTYVTAIRRPELVRGIAGLVGFMPRNMEDAVHGAPLAEIPVLVLAGKEDPLIPLETARESARLLRAAGASLEYREYDTGHKLNAPGMKKLRSWWASLAN